MTLIEGICAIPCISKNGVVYTPNELAKLDSKIVPLMYSHIGSPDDKGVQIADNLTVGIAETYWKAKEEELWYEAKLKEQYSTLLYRVPNLKVSIGAHYIDYLKLGVAFEITLEEISLTLDPAIPQTTLKIVESYSRQPRLDLASRMKLESAFKARESIEYDPNFITAVVSGEDIAQAWRAKKPTYNIEDIVLQYQAAKKERDAPKPAPKKKSRVKIAYCYIMLHLVRNEC